MNTAILILFLCLSSIVLYFVYQNAKLRFEIAARSLRGINARRIKHLKTAIDDLSARITNLEKTGIKQAESGEKTNKLPFGHNQLENSEIRRVNEIRERTVESINGKPFRT